MDEEVKKSSGVVRFFKKLLLVAILVAIFGAGVYMLLVYNGLIVAPPVVYNVMPVKSSIPPTDHGLYSAMTPVSKIKSVLDYQDEIYEYMKANWPDSVKAKESFGHHLSPTVELPYESHSMGYLKLGVSYDEDTKSPVSQSVVLTFYLDYTDSTAEIIVNTVDEYLGIKFNISDVERAVSGLALGASDVESKYGVLHISECEHPGPSFDSKQHIRVHIEFSDKVSEQTE